VARAAATLLPRPQRVGVILQRERLGSATHPNHQGNAQALRPLGRSLHRDGSRQPIDLPPPVG
jgi:hypothetical protein